MTDNTLRICILAYDYQRGKGEEINWQIETDIYILLNIKQITNKDLLWRRQWQPTPVLLPGTPMDGGAWQAAVHWVLKSQTRLSDFTFTFHFHALEKEMATHSSVLAWRIQGTEEPGGLPSVGSHRVGHDSSDLAAAAAVAARTYCMPLRTLFNIL